MKPAKHLPKYEPQFSHSGMQLHESLSDGLLSVFSQQKDQPKILERI